MSATLPRLVAVAVAAAVSVIAAGCSPSSERATLADGSSVVPGDTTQDWVTYGDVLVEFTVTEEQRIPATPAEVERGEGTIARQVTAQQACAPLWTRPSRAKAS